MKKVLVGVLILVLAGMIGLSLQPYAQLKMSEARFSWSLRECDARQDIYQRAACRVEIQVPQWDVTTLGLQQSTLRVVVLEDPPTTQDEFNVGMSLLLDEINVLAPTTRHQILLITWAMWTGPEGAKRPGATLIVGCVNSGVPITMDNGREYCPTLISGYGFPVRMSNLIWLGRGRP